MTDTTSAAIELRDGPIASAIRGQRLIVVLRRIEPQEELLALVDELADAGVRVFEVTFDAPTAANDLHALWQRLDARSDGPYVVGAGTILTRAQLDRARSAGADFGVSPVLALELLRAALGVGLPFIPAAMTPTEMHTAWLAGATFVKLFPASAVGPQFIRELRGPLPDIDVIPSGGVDVTNARAFLDAGAAAVGMASAIVRATPEQRRSLVQQLKNAD